MSTVAVDTARTSERLSAFMAEIGASEPVDNIFQKAYTIDKFNSVKKVQAFGRQILYPIDSGTNSTFQWFSDYDTFSTTAQNTALTVVYPAVNCGATVVISWEEMREVANDDVRVFDLVKHRRNNALKTITDQMNVGVHAVAQTAGQITAMGLAIDSTGAIGGLNASTDADWAAVETASGSFAAQGVSDMNVTFNTIQLNKGSPSFIVTTQAVYQFYELEIDPDVRYTVANLGKGARGFKELEFKGVPMHFDKDCASGVMYFVDTDHTFFIVDPDGDMKVTEFQMPVNQLAYVSKAYWRGNLVVNKRDANGKMTGITA